MKKVKIETIPLDKLVVSDANVRKHGVQKGRLVNSVKEDGVIEPIHVWHNKDTGFYEIMQGQHRYHAASQCNLKDIECIIHLNINSLNLARRWCRKQSCLQENLDITDKTKIVQDLVEQYGSLLKACKSEGLPYNKLKHWRSLSNLSEEAREWISHSGKQVPIRDMERVAAFPKDKHKALLSQIATMTAKEKDSFFDVKPSSTDQIVGIWLNSETLADLSNMAESEKTSPENLCKQIIEKEVKTWRK